MEKKILLQRFSILKSFVTKLSNVNINFILYTIKVGFSICFVKILMGIFL